MRISVMIYKCRSTNEEVSLCVCAYTNQSSVKQTHTFALFFTHSIYLMNYELKKKEKRKKRKTD